MPFFSTPTRLLMVLRRFHLTLKATNSACCGKNNKLVTCALFSQRQNHTNLSLLTGRRLQVDETVHHSNSNTIHTDSDPAWTVSGRGGDDDIPLS